MKKILMIALCVAFGAACMLGISGCSAIGDFTEDVEDAVEYADEGSGNSQPGVLNEGDEAPDFTASLAGGGTFTLSEHKDEVVLLNFWATWCGYCVDEMPDLQKLKDDNIDKLRIVEINCAETKDEVNRFIAQNGYTMDFAYDEYGEISSIYPTQYLPCTVIIKDGIAERIISGAPQDAYETCKMAVLECLEL